MLHALAVLFANLPVCAAWCLCLHGGCLTVCTCCLLPSYLLSTTCSFTPWIAVAAATARQRRWVWMSHAWAASE